MWKILKFFIFILIILEVVICFGIKRIKRGKKQVPGVSSILDTGRGSIGMYLNKSVKYLQPLRKHYNWKIHHNYHNREDVLEDVHVLPKDITLCEGEAGKFCPLGTTALCTKNDAIRCLTNLWDTEICDNDLNTHCAKISLPCDIYTPECRVSSKHYFNIMLPCISTINVYANLIDYNGTIIAKDLNKIYPQIFFCETILAMPAKLSKGEEVFSNTSRIFGQFAVKALGIDRS